MERLNFSVVIDSPREKVWQTMLTDETYRQWTSAFCEGSHYIGDWSEGNEITFLGPDESGKLRGMISRIRENRKPEYISIEHREIMVDGQRDPDSEASRAWAGAQENYTFKEAGSGTELLVEMDTDSEYREMFEEIWPKALQRLKELAEE